MARYSTKVNIRINGELVQNEDSSLLVPGDIIEVPKQQIVMPCDAIVLTGSVIINEAMLTGESIPVIKSSLPVSQSEVYI